MHIVIDANVIIAMLIKPGKPVEIFFREDLEISAPEIIFEELRNHKETIIKKSHISDIEIEELLRLLRKRIISIPQKEFIDHIKVAEKICPDPNDVQYFALALHLNCPIWTNEKRLKEQSVIKIYSTHELIEIFKH